MGANPYGVAFDGTSIWVSNSGGGSVTKLLASTGAVLGTFTVGNISVWSGFRWRRNLVANSVIRHRQQAVAG